MPGSASTIHPIPSPAALLRQSGTSCHIACMMTWRQAWRTWPQPLWSNPWLPHRWQSPVPVLADGCASVHAQPLLAWSLQHSQYGKLLLISSYIQIGLCPEKEEENGTFKNRDVYSVTWSRLKAFFIFWNIFILFEYSCWKTGLWIQMCSKQEAWSVSRLLSPV